MNNKDDALMRSWAKIALQSEGHDLSRDAAARFILKNVDDPYEEIEVGSVCIVKVQDEERVALRGETRWYLCETDEAFSDVAEAVEVVSELVLKPTPEATSERCGESSEILLDEFADPKPGEAWLIEYEGRYYEAIYWYSALYAHWVFVRNREGTVYIESHEATPVSRLVPESTPDHPTELTTEEDYKNAPAGTVVAGDCADPWVKHDLGFWRVCGEGGREINRVMALAARRVLRWGDTL